MALLTARTVSPAASVSGRTSLSSLQRRDRWVGVAFVAPQLVGWAAFVAVPLVMVVWYSLHDWQVLTNSFTFSGMDNYRRMFRDPSMHDALVASGIFSLGLVVLNVTLALFLALMLNQRLPGSTVFRAIFFSPVVASLAAWSIVWGFLLQNHGGINGFLELVGIDGPNWLRGGATAMLSVIVVQVLKGVGLNMILFLAALQVVPEELREAARLDGAGAWRVFRSITIPLISPTILMVSILTVIGSLEVFAQIAILTAGGPGNDTTVLVYYLYQQAFIYHDFGYGSAVSVLMFVVVLVLTLLQWQARRKWVLDET
ncbi:sugar ABC transporter permease [Nocardioides sp. KR10-350]|uniref:carbohydrate ABC transporter permease n=1 Tax=Nocardioides cheoyonin TaxID=3156615 RepID=UPI0032B5A91A